MKVNGALAGPALIWKYKFYFYLVH